MYYYACILCTYVVYNIHAYTHGNYKFMGYKPYYPTRNLYCFLQDVFIDLHCRGVFKIQCSSRFFFVFVLGLFFPFLVPKKHTHHTHK